MEFIKKHSNIVACVLLVAFILVVSLLRGSSTVSFDLSDTELTLKAPKGYTYIVPFEKIESMELCVSKLNLVQAIDGYDKNTCVWGIWNAEKYGHCTLCLTEKSASYITAKLTDGSYVVFNYQNNDTTITLFEQLLNYMEEKGFTVISSVEPEVLE